MPWGKPGLLHLCYKNGAKAVPATTEGSGVTVPAGAQEAPEGPQQGRNPLHSDSDSHPPPGRPVNAGIW